MLFNELLVEVWAFQNSKFEPFFQNGGGIRTEKVRVIRIFDADGPEIVQSKVCVTVVCLNRFFLTRQPFDRQTFVLSDELFVLSKFVLNEVWL